MNKKHARLVLAALTGMLAVALAACSSPSTTGGHGHTSASPSAPRTKAARAPKAASPLSGRWHGQYSGAYHGTFTLRWTQSGTHLNGTIKISQFASPTSLHGTVHGSHITFGTVGSMVITYSGTVSGNSMSGTYQVHGGTGPVGGPWSAAKTS